MTLIEALRVVLAAQGPPSPDQDIHLLVDRLGQYQSFRGELAGEGRWPDRLRRWSAIAPVLRVRRQDEITYEIEPADPEAWPRFRVALADGRVIWCADPTRLPELTTLFQFRCEEVFSSRVYWIDVHLQPIEEA